MTYFKNLKLILGEKSGKKLAVFSIVVFLLITVLVFFAAYEFCRNIHLNQMEMYLREIPKIIESRKSELLMRSHVYEDDILSRAELGLRLYEENNELTDAELLEQVRGAVLAESISILDGQRKVLTTTGPVSPEKIFQACIQDLEPRSPHLEVYPTDAEDEHGMESYDGKGFVMLPIGDTKRSLVFEFTCETMPELYNALNDWSDVLEHIISGGETSAFAKAGERLAAYQTDELPSEQAPELNQELSNVFANSDKFRSRWNGTPSKLITLLGDRYLAAMTEYPEENAEILLTDPIINVLRNGIFLAVAISAFVGWGMVLYQLYVIHRSPRDKDSEGTEDFSHKSAIRKTWPCILVILISTIIFSTMLLLLEKRTNATFTAKAGRENVQYEIDFRKDSEKLIRRTFIDFYRTRTQMLADYLMSHPDLQTHKDLSKLNSIAGSDYLMLFDKTGQELFSSNSYTGFTVGKNLSDEYRAVLLGYPYTVVGPEADPYTGQMQLSAAILMKDKEDQPDGFLLAVFSTEDLNSELKRMTYENAVNSFSVQKGHTVAAINNEDGRFIAHTDPELIGQKSADYLPSIEPGSSFEGYTDYNEKGMYVSASSADGKTLLYMVSEKGESLKHTYTIPVFIIMLLILTVLYYPHAGMLINRAMSETKAELKTGTDGNPAITIIFDGYSIFMTLFAIFAMVASSNGWWTSFEYVFSGQWSKGVHLFSVWAAILTTEVMLFLELLIRSAVNLFESRLSLQAKTITRMADSIIVYSIRFFLIFFIAYLFGVNTTALLASAGVISIAVGMGAKSLATDLLDGFFMMTEGTVHVGDYVRVGNVTGHVTNMGIRTTEITDDAGNVVTLNNSKVSGVCNMSRNHALQDSEKDQKKES